MKRFEVPQNGGKKAQNDEVKPFGNSQKGNGMGWLTWLIASDNYRPIKITGGSRCLV
jgi:hypothetical protein